MTSKLWTHSIARGPDTALLQAGMTGAKWVNSDPPANLPASVLAIWRWVEDPDSINDKMGNPNAEAEAQAWINKQWGHISFAPKFAYIEGPNENNCEDAVQAAWFSRFEIERMKIMAARGWKCCIGNFGTGRPSLPISDPNGVAIWTAMLPMLRYAKSNGHLLGMHAYHYDPHDIWHNLRYRAVYSWLPSDAQPSLVINEWGLDGALGRFRDSRWRDQYADPDVAYMDSMRAYDAEVQKDPYVLGFTVYTLGTGGSAAWAPFDIAGQPVVQLMAEYIRASAADPGHGGNDVGKFNVGQTVFVTAPGGVNLLDESAAQIGTASWGESGRVADGPRLIKRAQRWQVTFAGKVGWIDETFLETTMPRPPSGTTGEAWVRPHGTPAPVYADPSRSAQQLGTMLESSFHSIVLDAAYAEGMWWYKIELSQVGPGGWSPTREGRRNDEDDRYFDTSAGLPIWNSPAPLPDDHTDPPPDDPPPPADWPDPPAIPTGVNLMNGLTFEEGWTTDGKGNQIAKTFSLWYTLSNGEPMPFPSKNADSADGRTTVAVPARAMGWGEYIYKPNSLLTEVERLGGVRAIVLDGEHAFKGMGNIAQAFILSRKFRGTPGASATLVVHVSAESQDTPHSRVHPGRLEADHMLVGLQWGALPMEVRAYADMQERRDVRLPNGQVIDRPWNRFVRTTVFPASGELEMRLTCQNNWPRTFPNGGNDFFVDDIRVIVGDVTPPPPPDGVDLEPELERIEAATAGFSADYTAYQAVVAEQIALIRQKLDA